MKTAGRRTNRRPVTRIFQVRIDAGPAAYPAHAAQTKAQP